MVEQEQGRPAPGRPAGNSLKGKTLWVPRMSYGGAKTFAAVDTP